MEIKKLFFFVIVFFIAIFSLQAQDFLPFANDNYSGVTGVYLQPASIVDSRYKVDVTIGGASLNLNNNFLYLEKNDLLKFSKIKSNLKKNLDGTTKYIYQDAQIQALNAMVSVHPKWAVAFTARGREYVNAENFSDEMAQFAYDAVINKSFVFNNIEDLGNILYNQNPKANITSWAEYGLTGSTIVWQNDQHLVKTGLTIKVLQGLSATYLEGYIDKVKLYSTDSIGTLGEAAYFNYGTAGNLGSFKKASEKLNLGLDFGIVYEWRPDYRRYRYDMDGQTNINRPDLNKYKVKVGVSILDIGHIKYKKASGSQDFKIDGNFSLSLFNGIESIEDVSHVIDSMISLPPGDPNYGVFTSTNESEYYKMLLPTSLSFQIDYNIWNHFYINFTPYIAFRQGDKSISRVHALTTFSLTPRFETQFFGISLPFQYVQTKNLLMGLGLRIGPVWIGSNNIFGTLVNKEIDKLNISCMVKVPILYAIAKDADKDCVSDKMDRCKYEPGVWENQGCPKKDFDNDGVVDEMDECPDVYGLPEFNGCPDSDGDGVPDHKDDCPETFGFGEFNGCPDRDGDGIPDNIDDCPNAYGNPDLKGCPDKDGDGIPDHLDQCPDEYGTSDNHGCDPETSPEEGE